MIYRRKARDGLIDGANRQARFEPPAWSKWAILDARTTVFGPRWYDRTRGISAEETICAFRNGGSCGQAWRVEALTFDPPARFAIMIYRRKARDGLIDGANRQARFEPPAWSKWAILDARTTVFGPVRPMPIVPTPRARTPAAAGPI
ncbi:hypothetical protein AAC387_Pa02g2020 [Persea americana]